MNERLKKAFAEHVGHDTTSNILKSPLNIRRYKFIELDNGLRCLLISDPAVSPAINKTIVENSTNASRSSECSENDEMEADREFLVLTQPLIRF